MAGRATRPPPDCRDPCVSRSVVLRSLRLHATEDAPYCCPLPSAAIRFLSIDGVNKVRAVLLQTGGCWSTQPTAVAAVAPNFGGRRRGLQHAPGSVQRSHIACMLRQLAQHQPFRTLPALRAWLTASPAFLYYAGQLGPPRPAHGLRPHVVCAVEGLYDRGPQGALLGAACWVQGACSGAGLCRSRRTASQLLRRTLEACTRPAVPRQRTHHPSCPLFSYLLCRRPPSGPTATALCCLPATAPC